MGTKCEVSSEETVKEVAPAICVTCQDRERCRKINWAFADLEGVSCPVFEPEVANE